MKKYKLVKSRNRIFTACISACVALSMLSGLVLTGCGKDKEEAIEEDALLEKIPELSKFDDGMKMAHFISAPVDLYTIDDAISDYSEYGKGLVAPTDKYSAEYVMTLSDTSASFMLSDGMGEYGQQLSIELSESNGESTDDGLRQLEVIVREFLGGGLGSPLADEIFTFEPTGTNKFLVNINVDKDKLSLDVAVVEAKEEILGEEKSIDEDESVDENKVADDGKVAGDKLKTKDEIEPQVFSISEVQVPDIKMGAVGVYRFRGATPSTIDDILVKDNTGAVLFKEGFDDAKKNIFSPFYINVDYGEMVIDYGMLLTKETGFPAPVFRKEFNVEDVANIDRAYLYMTALGSFDAKINGQKVSNNYFDPGRLNYADRLNYASFDITKLIKDTNTIDITLFHGFYDRGVGYYEAYAPFGGTNALKGELVIEYLDGHTTIIPTDDSFIVSADGPVRFDDIYQGQIIDINHQLDEDSFVTVDIDEVEGKYLQMEVLPKETDNIKSVLDINPATVSEPVPGVYVYDFGQNFAGNISVKLPNGLMAKAKGTTEAVDGAITFRYGEAINSVLLLNADGPDGTVFTENLLSAKATDYFIYTSHNENLPKGEKLELGSKVNSRENPALYDVEFNGTYHGFRYLEVTGVSEAIPVDCITAHVLSTAMEQTGYFSCSNAALNRYYENSRFSLLSNFLDTPTDCAQRDERLGWAGDAYDSSLFASYIMNTDQFYSKYVRDLCSRQLPDGSMPDIAPQRIGGHGNNCWGDAAINIAYELYVQFGDKEILEENYDSFKRWVDYLIDTSDDYIRYHTTYGDHLSVQSTVPELSDTAWCAHSTYVLSRIAEVLGNTDDAEYYSIEFENYKRAWQDKFVRSDASVNAGILFDESETAYALGICFELFEDDMLQSASDRLKILAEYSNYQFGPGYSGLNFVLPALARFGHADTAMSILTNTDKGSPLYTVGIGMTTTPELLNSIDYYDNGSYIIKGSLNHHAFAGICAYLYTDILGIRADEEHPGFKHFYLAPKVAGSMTSAEGTFTTKYGDIGVSVKTNSLDVIVPEGTTCTLTLPDGTVNELSAGGYSYTW